MSAEEHSHVHLSESAYFHDERVWTVIAASTGGDPDVVTDEHRAMIGTRERERVWRFKDKADAEAWAQEVGAEPPTRIADLPHHCNGWVVRTREPA